MAEWITYGTDSSGDTSTYGSLTRSSSVWWTNSSSVTASNMPYGVYRQAFAKVEPEEAVVEPENEESIFDDDGSSENNEGEG